MARSGRLDGTVMTACYSVRQLVRTFRAGRGRPPVRASDGIDLDVQPAEVFGLLGPNGAGKTTLARQLMGLLRPDSGGIRLLGRDLVAEPRLAARCCAYLAQDEPALAELPARLAVETTARLRGVARRRAAEAAGELLEELGVGGLADRPVRRLSGGERRLVGVAAALIGDRSVLVLDEPTAGLDPVSRRAVWAAVERRRASRAVTVVLVTHNVLEAETVLDRVAVLDGGRLIACDTPGRLKAALGGDVRLEVVWRADPPLSEPVVAELAGRATVAGRRWTVRLPHPAARAALDRLTGGPAVEALDDFTLAMPTLEDVYLSLGGHSDDLERG
jgi:ABC-2 type transport system ATP-binding protein